MNEQVSTLQRPTTDNREGWKTYWEAKGQPWRTEPDIDRERQQYLAARRTIVSDRDKGVFPFKNVGLSRADIEWLVSQKATDLDLTEADMRGIDLTGLPLKGATLNKCRLEASKIEEAHLEGASLTGAYLRDASLIGAYLQGANLVRAELYNVDLENAHLEQANLGDAHLEGASLYEAHLEGCNLGGAFLDATSFLEGTILTDDLHGPVSVIGTHWGGADLSAIEWTKVKKIYEEVEADYPEAKQQDGEEWRNKRKPSFRRLYEYQIAARANRQLSVALRDQGLSEEGAYFAYRAQQTQRKILWHRKRLGQYLLSLLLDLLSGYGYKPGRSFIAYLIVIAAFAVTYFIIGHTVGPVLSPLGSVVFSMTSFHGRGFFPGGIGLDDPLTVVAAFEAFVGLLIEVTFIATLTQRLFGK